ncbi:MAG: hypothetical protein NTU91_08490 [Chloroflexi bacterium]|nr:hypothetical protein [Chloroflexota bacterium]
MDKRTLGIILTVVTVLFCGCPGLFICLFGGLTAAGLGTYTTDVLGTTGVGELPTGSGYGMLCGGLILIAIPIVIGVVMLRKPKAVPPTDIVPPVS